MDTKLRELERAALGGDAEAKKRFLIEKLRTGNYYPVMLPFSKWNLSSAPSLSNMPGKPYGSFLTAHGRSHNMLTGPVVPKGSILRGINVSVDSPGKVDYDICVCVYSTGFGTLLDRTKDFGSFTLEKGLKVAGCRDLCGEVGMVPLGVRVEGAQSSTWSAIYVTLEIWIPG